jgi:flagellar protein FliO/FliZ
MKAKLAALGLFGLASNVLANSQSVLAQPSVISSGNVGSMALSLVVVIAAILVVVFVLKKLMLGKARVGNMLNIVSSVSLGTRERLVVVEADGKFILLGATAHSINKLHVYEHSEPKLHAQSAEPTESFMSIFMKNLRKQRNG